MAIRYQVLILLAGTLLLVMSNAINFGPEQELDVWRKVAYLGLLTLSIAAHFFTIFFLAKWMQRRMPGLKYTSKRLLSTLLWSIPVELILMLSTDMLLTQFSNDEVYQFFGWKTLLFNLAQSTVTSIFIIGLTEAFYHYELLHHMEQEKETLQRENLAAQYSSLKQQINPHFLFNSLNSLSSLISIDPDKAEAFVEELSRVYRYLLQKNQEELIPLGQELDFIQSYLHLLQTRFGNGLEVALCVPKEAHSFLMPPLTLQLLVENAVKHNEISVAKPLRLRIWLQEGERLVVANNLQKRNITVPSAGIGLGNIIARYRLLNHPYVEVRETEEEFAVTIPLIKTTST
jgi:two-component system, LytTR family, sensor kinase